MNDYNIKELYEEMEMHLIKSMQRNLSRHLKEESEVGFEYPQWQAIKLKELKRYQRENKDIIKKYTLGLDKDVSEHLQRELKQGSLQAINEYNKTHKNKLSPDKLMTKSFFKTNDRKINNLIKVVNNDLNKANIGALRMMNDQYRQIIHKSAFFVGNGVLTEKQATDMAIAEISEKKATMKAVDEASKSFLAGGLNCIEYKDSKRVNIASYAEMAVRTASLRTHLMGEGDFRKSIGRTLVQVTTHGESCDGCAGWEGKILVDDVYSGGKPDGKHTLLSEAMAQGLFHPSCRHGLTTFYEELEDVNYDTKEDDFYLTDKQRNRQNYIDRNIRKYNRLSSGSLDENNKKKYRLKENEWKKIKPVDYVDINNQNMIKYRINKYEKEISISDNEQAYIINRIGEVLKFEGNKGNINIPRWLDLSGSVITHNHPIDVTNYSLSEDDLILFLDRNVKQLRGIDDKYTYYFKRKKNTIVNIDSIKEDITKLRMEVFELSMNDKINIDIDGYHYINEKLSNKYNFIYVRRKRK